VRRRELLLSAGAAIAVPLPANGEEKAPLVGVLMATSEDDPESIARFDAFQQGLSEAGWSAGRNLRIETRWIAGDPARGRS
jgi:hypothetical protein